MSSVIIDYEEGEESFRQTTNHQIPKNNANILKKHPEISEEEEYLAEQ
jgi:hypothetical protein